MRWLVALYDKALAWSRHRYAARYLAAVAFIESCFFPIPPDFMLAPMSLAKPNAALRYAYITTTFSVLGGIIGYALGFFLFKPIIQPILIAFNYLDYYDMAFTFFNKWGFVAMLLAGFTPIPYKFFTISAGVLQCNLLVFILASILGRGLRFFLVAICIKSGGEKMERVIRKVIDKLGWLCVAVATVVFLVINLSGCSYLEQSPANIRTLPVLKSDRFKTTRHVVRPGETLYSIAWQTKMDYLVLAKINNIKSPYVIYPGDVISLSKNNFDNKYNNKFKNSVNKTNKKAKNANKSKRISSWVWPAEGKLIKKYSAGVSNGIDIKNQSGTAILAIAPGEVVYSGNALRGYGNLIIIKHDNNFLSAYAHNRKNMVKERERVVVGQKIAEMGKTESDQVILHFEIRQHGKPINPQKVLPKS